MKKYYYWIFERNPSVDPDRRIERIGSENIDLPSNARAQDIRAAILATFPKEIAERDDLVVLF